MSFLAAEVPDDVSTRRAAPRHAPWTPWKYQSRGVDFLMERGAAALFLDPGLGKTSIVLEAFRRLKEAGMADRMLVVAPLRVCQLVWEQEGRKWTQFRGLTFSLIHGPKKADRLKEKADIHLINPEGIPWLAQQFYGRSDLPWDTVVIDELTKFKNHRAQRSTKLRKKLKSVRRRWGLTGSPAPNGYMDLFGQMLMLDDGAALGKFITYYRDQYFIQGYNGFDWALRGDGAAKRIEERIAPYVLRMSAKDYLDLPPLKDNVISVELPPDAKRQYEEMKRDMLLALPEGVVTAANAGAVYSKLKQLANGAVYLPDGKFAEVHKAKLDAVEDLIEELAGQPLLIAYEFQHDLIRLRARLGEDTPTLSGLTGKRIAEVEAAWNRGDLPVLLVHPASAGHGLNLQGAGAAHICWFSRPWDLELYEQTYKRILRQGSTAERVMNHILCVSGTMDDTVGEALEGKDTTQQRLLTALNAEILRDDPAPIAAGSAARTEDEAMPKKLGFRGNAGPAEEAPAPTARVAPKGWGPAPSTAVAEDEDLPPTGGPSAYEDSGDEDSASRPKGWGPPAGAPVDPQRAEIRQKIAAPPAEEEPDEEEAPASVRALSAFPEGVVDSLTGDGDDGDDGDDEGNAEDVPNGEDDASTWEGLSTRYANALRAAGLVSPEHAYQQGKDALIANVDRFGEKGWAELQEMFEGTTEKLSAPDADDTDVKPAEPAQSVPQATTTPKGWGSTPRTPEPEPDPEQPSEKPKDPRFASAEAERYHEARQAKNAAQQTHPAVSTGGTGTLQGSQGGSTPTGRINIEYYGVPADAMAQLFEALAASLRK